MKNSDRFSWVRKPVPRGVLVGAAVGVPSLFFGIAALAQSSPDMMNVLAKRLPKTEVTAVDCDKIDGLCEVQAGSNLFYTDHDGRYLVIGRVYDMETKQDLTAARLLEINPDMLVGSSASNGARAGAGEARVQASAETDTARKIDVAELTGLPKDGAIEWGRGSASVTVFSDFRCGYCKQLHQTLETMNVKVMERPISILGTRAISDAVVCSSDRRRAVRQAYEGGAITSGGSCDTSGLDANEAFARKHGFTGTPVMVRSDGEVIQGYRPREFLEAWLKGGKS